MSSQHLLLYICNTIYLKNTILNEFKVVSHYLLFYSGVRNFDDSDNVQFDTTVVMALLETLLQVPLCWSAGALRWFFALLSHLTTLDTVNQVTQKALGLLKQVARNLHARQNPNHLLLQTRYAYCNYIFVT